MLTVANLFSVAAIAASNPASTDYVNARFNDAVRQGTYTAGTGISILNNVISGAYTVSNGLGINGADILGYTSGIGVTVNGAGGGATPASLDVALISGNNGITVSGNTITETQLEIGQLYQGGIIFYLDSTKRHGLAISMTNSTTNSVPFTSAANTHIYASMTGIGAGAFNTAVMLAAEANVNDPQSAAPIAAARGVTADGLTSCVPSGTTVQPLTETCYGGWYIPSVGEYQQIQLAGNTTINDAVRANGGSNLLDTFYWSSTTTSDGTKAFDTTLEPDNTIEGNESNLVVLRPVRTIRAF
ncbi:MAG: hypothetical protein P1U39_01205 [Legionellaceae bacterium]|nr:hypothetical protein [Legionellaceae bacterium]